MGGRLTARIGLFFVSTSLVLLAAAPALGADVAPRLLLPAAKGPPFDLYDHVGPKAAEPKPVVLIFLDTKEPTCARRVSGFKKMAKELDSAVVVHVGYRQGKKKLLAYKKKHRIPWQILFDRGAKGSKRYGLKKAPLVVVAAPDGSIAYRSVDPGDGVFAAVSAKLRELAPQPTARMPVGGTASILGFTHKLRFGRPPAAPGASTRWQPLGMRIGAETDSFVSMLSTETYEEFVANLKEGKYDLANGSPLLASQVLDLYEPLVSLGRRDQITYRGIFFGLKSSNLNGFGDLQNKTVALVSMDSSSGGLFPFAKLTQSGLEPGVNVRLIWTGSHQKVAEAIRSKEADAGACFEDCRELVWRSAEQREAETHIFGYTDSIPAEVIVVRRDVDAALKARLKAALLKLSNDTNLLAQITKGEEPITSIVAADEAALRAAAESITGIEDKLAAAKRRESERRRRDNDLLLR